MRHTTKHEKSPFPSPPNLYLLEGGHGQRFRLGEREGVTVPLLESALRSLAARADSLALVTHEHARRVAEKELQATKRDRDKGPYSKFLHSFAVRLLLTTRHPGGGRTILTAAVADGDHAVAGGNGGRRVSYVTKYPSVHLFCYTGSMGQKHTHTQMATGGCVYSSPRCYCNQTTELSAGVFVMHRYVVHASLTRQMRRHHFCRFFFWFNATLEQQLYKAPKYALCVQPKITEAVPALLVCAISTRN